MANWVRAMSELRTFAGIVTSGWGKAGRAGKLSLDIPTILYFLRSQRISTQWFSSSLKRISSSGSKRTSSSSLLAGIVPEPSFFTLASHPVRMLSSRSVAVIVRRLPFASHSRFDRMGMVVFRSTTPCVKESSSSRSNFFTLNSIACDPLVPSGLKQNNQRNNLLFFGESIKLVVVMSAVERWKTGSPNGRLERWPCARLKSRLCKALKTAGLVRQGIKLSARVLSRSTGFAQDLHSPDASATHTLERSGGQATRRAVPMLANQWLAEGVQQLVDGAVQVFVSAAQGIDFVDGVQDGGVVLPAELPADFRQRRGGELLREVHGDLAGEGDGLGVAPHLEVMLSQAKLFADAFLDQLDGHLFFLRGDNVSQYLLRGRQVDPRPGQRGVGHKTRQGPFQLPDIRLD